MSELAHIMSGIIQRQAQQGQISLRSSYFLYKLKNKVIKEIYKRYNKNYVQNKCVFHFFRSLLE